MIRKWLMLSCLRNVGLRVYKFGQKILFALACFLWILSKYGYTMNYRVLLLGLCAWGSLPVLGQESRVEDIRIGGFVGGRIHTCIEQRVKSQDVEHLVEPFRHRGEKATPRPI